MSVVEILLIDDDEEIGFLMAMYAKKADMHITLATTADAGIEQASKLRLDLIILDMGLPGTSGIEVLAQLKANAETREIPVLVMSGNESAEMKRVALEGGAIDYLIKPMNRGGFVDKIRGVLGIQPA